MQTSEYFDLGLYEGTDIFNPLMVENENIEKIDEQMFLNSIASVSQATELKSGTVHALTRVNPDASMFRFVATSKFDRGDTFTVDGIQVSGLTTDGKALEDGAYVINSNVLCCLTGTVLTLFVSSGTVTTAENAEKLGGQLPAYYGTAEAVQQANTVAQAAGVLANDIQGQVNVINSFLSKIDNEFIKTVRNNEAFRAAANARTEHAVVNVPTLEGYTLVALIGCIVGSTYNITLQGFGNDTGESYTIRVFNSTTNERTADCKLTWLFIKNV